MTGPGLPDHSGWRRRAAGAQLLTALIGLAILAVAVAIVMSWRDQLPDPVASHWSSGPDPDGFSSLTGYVTALCATYLGCTVLFGIVAVVGGHKIETVRILAGANVYVAGTMAIILVGSLALQRGLANARHAPNPGWLMALAFMAPLVPAVIAAWAVIRRR